MCPVCAMRVGVDMVAHITLQHGNIFKISFYCCYLVFEVSLTQSQQALCFQLRFLVKVHGKKFVHVSSCQGCDLCFTYGFFPFSSS